MTCGFEAIEISDLRHLHVLGFQRIEQLAQRLREATCEVGRCGNLLRQPPEWFASAAGRASMLEAAVRLGRAGPDENIARERALALLEYMGLGGREHDLAGDLPHPAVRVEASATSASITRLQFAFGTSSFVPGSSAAVCAALSTRASMPSSMQWSHSISPALPACMRAFTSSDANSG